MRNIQMAHSALQAAFKYAWRPHGTFTRLYRTFHPQTPRLTRQQVTSYLRAHEHSLDISNSGYAVTGFDSNYIRSNNPIEDRRSMAKCIYSSGLLFGVFDGHSGIACAQAVSERLFQYIALTLLQYDDLKGIHQSMEKGRAGKVLEWYRHKHEYANEYLAPIYRQSLRDYAKDLLDDYSQYGHQYDVAKSLEKAFIRMDSDISREAFASVDNNPVNLETLPVALSGSCATVIYVNKRDVFVANAGDCKALLGSISETGNWIVKPLSTEHTAENQSEVDRIKNEHPQSESHTVLSSHRLFGELMPLRAFGDFRYKWDLDKLKLVHDALSRSNVSDITPYHAIPPRGYSTPPYLTATPEITHYKLNSQDKFIVLASDGLWDLVRSEKAINLVAGHLDGKQAQEKFITGDDYRTLDEINTQLIRRKSGIANRPVDTNVATSLIRNALGFSEAGVEHRKLSAMLTLPDDIVREYRDDITVTVIHLDTQEVILDDAPVVSYF